MYMWEILRLCNTELGYFKPFEVSGEGVRTVGCGGKTTSFSLVPDVDRSLGNLRQDCKTFIVRWQYECCQSACWALIAREYFPCIFRWCVLLGTKATLFLDLIGTARNWASASRFLQLSWRALCQRIQTLGCDMFPGLVWFWVLIDTTTYIKCYVTLAPMLY